MAKLGRFIVVLDCQTHFVATLNLSSAVKKSKDPGKWESQKKEASRKLFRRIEEFMKQE